MEPVITPLARKSILRWGIGKATFSNLDPTRSPKQAAVHPTSDVQRHSCQHGTTIIDQYLQRSYIRTCQQENPIDSRCIVQRSAAQCLQKPSGKPINPIPPPALTRWEKGVAGVWPADFGAAEVRISTPTPLSYFPSPVHGPKNGLFCARPGMDACNYSSKGQAHVLRPGVCCCHGWPVTPHREPTSLVGGLVSMASFSPLLTPVIAAI